MTNRAASTHPHIPQALQTNALVSGLCDARRCDPMPSPYVRFGRDGIGTDETGESAELLFVDVASVDDTLDYPYGYCHRSKRFYSRRRMHSHDG